MTDFYQNFVMNRVLNMNVQDDKVIRLVDPFKDLQQHQIDNFSLFLGDSKKCRCCFTKSVNVSGQSIIDFLSRQAFFAMTGVELNMQDSDNFFCMNCSDMLRIFSELRKTAKKLQESYNDFLDDIANDIVSEKEEETDEVSGQLRNVDCIVISDDESCTEDDSEQTSPPQQTISLSGMHDSKVTFDDEDVEILKEIMHIFEQIPETETNDQVAESNARLLTESAARLTRLNPETVDQYDSFSIDGNKKEQTIIRSSAASAESKMTLMMSFIKAKFLLEGIHYNDKKIFHCPICGKLTKNGQTMRAHVLRTHTHSLKINCDLCGKSFSHKQSLVNHMYTQHMKVKFSCNLCTAEFRSAARLNAHKRNVHEKKYKCDECNFKAGESKPLVEHISVEHEGKRFYCSYPNCLKKYKFRCQARKHLHQAHSLEGDIFKNYSGKLMLK